MAKRPQGLHKSAQSKKKQKVSSEPKDDIQHIDAPGALEFEQDIDPTDELKSLFAMYDETLGHQNSGSGAAAASIDPSNPLHQLSPEKMSSMIIHSCDNILRMHSQKDTADETKEADQDKSTIELLPKVLPSKFHAVYASALLKMAKILHEQEADEEDEDSSKQKNGSSSKTEENGIKPKHDTPIDFVNAAIERCEIGLEDFPEASDLLFTYAAALITKVSETSDSLDLEDDKAITKELIEPIATAQEKYEKAEESISSAEQDFSKVYTLEVFSVLHGLLGISDWIASNWGEGETDLGAKLVGLKEKYLKWGIKRYQHILKNTESSVTNSKKDAKGKVAASLSETQNEELARKAHTGLGQFYVTLASPLVEQFENVIMMLPDEEDEDNDTDLDAAEIESLKTQLKSVTAKATKLVEQGVQHFTQAEPDEDTAQDNEAVAIENGERFACTGEALIQLGNLTQDEEKQEELYKKAVHKLRLAQRLGAGDFSEQIRDLVVE